MPAPICSKSRGAIGNLVVGRDVVTPKWDSGLFHLIVSGPRRKNAQQVEAVALHVDGDLAQREVGNIADQSDRTTKQRKSALKVYGRLVHKCRF